MAKFRTARTTHTLQQGDARRLEWITDESVPLVVTSPPYWTLKEYPDHEAQLGLVEDYERFHDELEKVRKHCYRVLVPGGRIACVAGDVCMARRKNKGRHMVMPLHADISVRARRVGFDYLTPILWHKIANASYDQQQEESRLSKEEHARWFRSFWTDVAGESTRHHPAPFPVEVACRFVRMFSLVEPLLPDNRE